MSTSVVIVSYFTGEALKECLKAVHNCLGIDDVIIVDNGNTPDTQKWMDGFAKQNSAVSILRGQGNVGFAKACNAGGSAATGAQILFLNPDAVLQADALAQLQDALKNAAPGSIVGARLLNKDGSEQRGARRGRLTPWSALISMTGLTRFERHHPIFADMHQERQPIPEHPTPVHAISGACMLMRHDDFERLGGFDETYFLHVEDLDICRRVRALGGQIIFVPKAEIVHYGSTSKASRLKVDWHKAKGLSYYFYRFAHSAWERVGAVIIAIPIIAAVMLRSLMLVLRQRLG